MPIEPIKIPQNVYIEDRIIGPLTIRQVMITAIGGGISYAIWASLQKAYGVNNIGITIIAWIPCAIATLFAFVHVNDLSLARILLLLLERSQKSTVRTFSPREGLSITIRTFSQQAQEKEQPHAKVREISRIQEVGTFLDQDPSNEALSLLSQQQEPLPQIIIEPLSHSVDNPQKKSHPQGETNTPKPTVSIFHDLQPPATL